MPRDESISVSEAGRRGGNKVKEKYGLEQLPHRIQNKILVLPNGCWEWVGYISTRGYGMVCNNGRPTTAHRVVYEYLVGPLLYGQQIDHLCRNRGCVSPYHLESVSAWENIRRSLGIAAINATKEYCLAGHPFDGQNTYIRRGKRRECRACNRERLRRIRGYYERRGAVCHKET